MVGVKGMDETTLRDGRRARGTRDIVVQAAWGAPVPLRLLELGVIPAGDYDTSLDPPFFPLGRYRPFWIGHSAGEGTRSEAIEDCSCQTLLLVHRMVVLWCPLVQVGFLPLMPKDQIAKAWYVP